MYSLTKNTKTKQNQSANLGKKIIKKKKKDTQAIKRAAVIYTHWEFSLEMGLYNSSDSHDNINI